MSLFEGSSDELAEALIYYQQNPVVHIQEIQGVGTLEKYQIEKIIHPIRDNKRVAIRACHNVGKTFTIAKVILWIGSSFPGSKIITTAPSAMMVKKLLWSEIRSGHRKSKIPLGGKMLEVEWKIEDDWFVIGISPDDGGESSDGTQGTTSTFQGFHSPEGMVVLAFDEATGVSAKRWIQAEGMMTQPLVKFIAIGNPTSPSSPFAQCFKDPTWYKSHISCFDSPNLPANGFHNVEDIDREVAYLKTLSDIDVMKRLESYVHVNHYLLTAEWVVSLALRRGTTSPVFVSKALGDFPDQDDHVLIPLSVVERSQRRKYEPLDADPRYLGIDVARQGSDETVLTLIEGWQVIDVCVVSKFDGEAVAGEAIRMIMDRPRRRTEAIQVDGTGVGSSVVDFLRVAIRDGTLPKHVVLNDIQFGEGFKDTDDEADREEDERLYTNKKAKMFDCLAEDMKENLCIPPDNIYQEELPGIKYKFDKKGRYILESKDDYKSRTKLGSPDHADSLALANFGRHVIGQVGSFSEAMKKAAASRSPVASSLRSGDQW
jgi:phage terminase large subunit